MAQRIYFLQPIQFVHRKINHLDFFCNCDAIFINILVNTQTHAPSSLIFHYIHLHHAESMSTHSFTLTNIITCRYTLSYNKAEHTPQPYTIHTPTHSQSATHSLILRFCMVISLSFFFLVVLFFSSSSLYITKFRTFDGSARSLVWSCRVFVHNDEC